MAIEMDKFLKPGLNILFESDPIRTQVCLRTDRAGKQTNKKTKHRKDTRLLQRCNNSTTYQDKQRNYRYNPFRGIPLALGEAGSATVLPPCCGPLSPGSIPGPSAVCPFGFQSKLASAGFSPGTPVFLLHLKLDFFLDSCLFLFVQRAFLESSACSLSKATLCLI